MRILKQSMQDMHFQALLEKCFPQWIAFSDLSEKALLTKLGEKFIKKMVKWRY